MKKVIIDSILNKLQPYFKVTKSKIQLLSNEEFEFLKDYYKIDNIKIQLYVFVKEFVYGFRPNYICPICGNILSPNNIKEQFNQRKIDKCCSTKCAQELMFIKTGYYNCQQDPLTKEKKKKTTLMNYGVQNPQFSKDIVFRIKTSLGNTFADPVKKNKILEKTKNTNLKKYGIDFVTKLDQVKEKTKNTNLKKYGAEFYTQTEEYKIKRNKTILEKYESWENYYNIWRKTYYNNQMLKYGVSSPNKLDFIKIKQAESLTNFYQNNPQKGNKLELQIISYLTNELNLSIDIKRRNIIAPFEIDIYIPSYNIAIEINGNRFHQTEFKNKNYHVNKTNECEKRGIRLIHIWEHEWNNNQEYVKYVLDCYLNNKITQLEGLKKLNRDYFSRLDFPDLKIEDPNEEIIKGKYVVYKQGYMNNE